MLKVIDLLVDTCNVALGTALEFPMVTLKLYTL